MEVGSKLEAIVGSTNKISFTSLVSIMLSSISRSITVSLSLITWILRSAASLAIKIATSTSLSLWRLYRNSTLDIRNDVLHSQCLWIITTIILWMIICTELPAIVAATNQFSLTPLVTIIGSPIKRSITVTFS